MRNYKISKIRNSWAGRTDSVLVNHRLRSEPSPAPARSQRPALLQAAAETTAGGSTGKEDLKTDRRVCYYKEVGLQ